jgi:hypothetical protein
MLLSSQRGIARFAFNFRVFGLLSVWPDALNTTALRARRILGTVCRDPLEGGRPIDFKVFALNR